MSFVVYLVCIRLKARTISYFFRFVSLAPKECLGHRVWSITVCNIERGLGTRFKRVAPVVYLGHSAVALTEDMKLDDIILQIPSRI